MANSYLEIKDNQRTAWYESEKIRNIAQGAAPLNKAIDTEPDPDLATMEKCAGTDLRPITQEAYNIAVRDLAHGRASGLIAEIDLADGQAAFTYLSQFEKEAYRVGDSVSRIAGIYEMSVDHATGKLDERALTSGLVQHCMWEHIKCPAERFCPQEQEPPSGQGMTMS